MDCDSFLEKLPDFLNIDMDDPPDPEELDEFYAHLESCEDCLKAHDTLLMIYETLKDHAEEAFCGKLDEKVANRVIEIALRGAKLAEENGDYEEAAKLLKKALELRPDDEKISLKLNLANAFKHAKESVRIWYEDYHNARTSQGEFQKYLDNFTSKQDLNIGNAAGEPKEYFEKHSFISGLESIPEGELKNWSKGLIHYGHFKYPSEEVKVDQETLFFASLKEFRYRDAEGVERTIVRPDEKELQEDFIAKFKEIFTIKFPDKKLDKSAKKKLYDMPEKAVIIFLYNTYRGISFRKIGTMLSMKTSAIMAIYCITLMHLLDVRRKLSLNAT